jgi:hypothetical protein
MFGVLPFVDSGMYDPVRCRRSWYMGGYVPGGKSRYGVGDLGLEICMFLFLRSQIVHEMRLRNIIRSKVPVGADSKG